MSTEPAPKTHSIEGLSRLSIVYLRNALNNPQWVSGLEGYTAGMEAIVAVPKRVIPKDLTSDEAVLAWADAEPVPAFTITDAVRDTIRTALKHAFSTKSLPVNEHATALIAVFSLKT